MSKSNGKKGSMSVSHKRGNITHRVKNINIKIKIKRIT